jgi:hypothetical protein
VGKNATKKHRARPARENERLRRKSLIVGSLPSRCGEDGNLDFDASHERRVALGQIFTTAYASDPWSPLTDIFDLLAVDSVIDPELREDLQDALAYVWQHGRADAVSSLTLTIPSEGSDTPEFERRLLPS